MKIIALVLLTLAIMAQVMIWVSDVKWRGIYAQHRHLDRMPANAQPRREHRMWGITGIWSHRMRTAFGIGSVACGALSFFI